MIDPKWEPTARRIRAMAAEQLRRLPVEDPDVVWARRAALLAERGRGEPPVLNIPRRRSTAVLRRLRGWTNGD